MTTSSPPSIEQAGQEATAVQEGEAQPARGDGRRLFTAAGPSGGLLRLLGALALLATVAGRAIAPALPGSTTGIDIWIVVSEQGAAFLGQLFVVASCLVAVRLLITILRDARLGVAFRLGSAPAGAAAITLVIASTKGPIHAEWTLALGLVAALLAAAATPRAVMSVPTRAAGFVLGLGATVATLQVCGRLVAMHASDQALPNVFLAARGLATGALALDVLILIVVGIWLGAGRWWRAALVAFVLLAVSALVSWGALRGSHYEAALWQVLASRTLAVMTRHPTPLVAPWLVYGVQLATLLAVVVVLSSRRRGHAIHAVVALTILAAGATDIPVLAMALTLAALIASLASVSKVASWVGAEHATEPDSPDPEPTPSDSPGEA